LNSEAPKGTDGADQRRVGMCRRKGGGRLVFEGPLYLGRGEQDASIPLSHDRRARLRLCNSNAQLTLPRGNLGGQAFLVLLSGIKRSLDHINSSFDSYLLVA
jgi:hypothetical protein